MLLADSIEPIDIRCATQQGGEALTVPHSVRYPKDQYTSPMYMSGYMYRPNFQVSASVSKLVKMVHVYILKMTECGKKLEMARLIWTHKELKSG